MKLFIDSLKCFAQLDANRLLVVLKRDVEMEHKVVLQLRELRVYLLWLPALEHVAHEDVCDEVKED